MLARLHVGFDWRFLRGFWPVRPEGTEGLSLPARRMDLRTPGRLAVGRWLSARLSARTGNCRCVCGDPDVRRASDPPRLGILPHYGAADALAAHRRRIS